jgi:uncharacterized protein
MSERRTALVTGASGGIGLELARLLAADRFDLVITARSGGKLEALASELRERHGGDVHVITSDLAQAGAVAGIVAQLKERGVRVDALVNNAGFAMYGPFIEADQAQLMGMLQVNMAALTELTRAYLPPMVQRKWGRVLNVASTAAFQPGPLMAAYYASKAYVLNLSIALNEEVRGTGVSVTALCPGSTQSGFQERARMQGSRLVANRKLPSSAEVADVGFAAMKAGKPMVVVGARNRALAFSARLGPRPLIARVVMKAQAPVDVS